MDRNKEIENFLIDYRKKRKEIKQIYVDTHISSLILPFQRKLSYCISEQIQREDGANKIKFIYLCQILSSGYTGSYDVVLGMSNAMLYLDENKSQVCWYPELIYENMDKDMEEVEILLRKCFFRLDAYELFYIKQKLLHDNWELLQECFGNLCKQSAHLIMDSPLKREDEILFLSGNYLDSLKIKWHTEIPVRICQDENE